jgi:hypothetical protein
MEVQCKAQVLVAGIKGHLRAARRNCLPGEELPAARPPWGPVMQLNAQPAVAPRLVGRNSQQAPSSQLWCLLMDNALPQQ